MRLRTTPAALAAALLLPLLVAGCGEDDPFADYCAVVEKEKPGLLQALDESGARTGLLGALPYFERLEDAAPDDIADDWSVLVQRLRSLSQAIEAAGADPATYDPDNPPAGITKAQLDAIALAASSLGLPAVDRALGSVQQQAMDVCGTSLQQTS